MAIISGALGKKKRNSLHEKSADQQPFGLAKSRGGVRVCLGTMRLDLNQGGHPGGWVDSRIGVEPRDELHSKETVGGQ